jgi:CRP-like cAMP-binding protein
MSDGSGLSPRRDVDGVSAPPKLPQNQILLKLPADELAVVLEHTSETSFGLREELFEDGDNIEQVHFPLNLMISLINVLEDGTAVELMTIGREGFVGFTLFNDVATARYKGVCQFPGDCLTIDAKTFLRIIDELPNLRRRLHRYSQFASEVVAQSVACNSVHNVEQRLARWLLVTSDAIGTKSFDITQEFLSQMLAVRRAGVTNAMGTLGRRGLLEHQYGKVTLQDVEGLKKTSCECYRRIREKAAELLD